MGTIPEQFHFSINILLLGQKKNLAKSMKCLNQSVNIDRNFSSSKYIKKQFVFEQRLC